MEYTLHHDFAAIDPEDWNALLREAVTDAPFLRFEYQRAWWDHRGGGEWPQAQLVLVAGREGGRLAGVAPLFRAAVEGRQSLLLVGSIEISDYLDLIVRAADHARFLTGLLDLLAADAGGPLHLDWYNLPQASPTLAALQAEADGRGWLHHAEIYRPTPYIPLRGDFEEYLGRVDKKQRHEIRRKLRRAEESGRGVRWFVSDMREPEAEIEAFIKLMGDDENKARFLSEPMRAQMRAILLAAHAQGWLWLAFLEADGRRIAASLNFDYNGRIWGYNAGVDRAYMDLSPGWVLLTHILKWCCENGRAEFDFMRGDEEYKYRFGALNRHVMRATLSAPGSA